jgi:hypothetical protein
MITWAALIILQAVEGGFGESGDIQAIRVHLDLLRQNNEPTPSLHRRLADRLESKMQDVQKDIGSLVQSGTEECADILSYDWSLFDETSLQGVNDLWGAMGRDQVC